MKTDNQRVIYIIILIFIVVGLIYLGFNLPKGKENNEAKPVNLNQQLLIKNDINKKTKLSLPGINVYVLIPQDLFVLNDNDIVKYNEGKDQYNSDFSCGTFFQETKAGNGFWLSYRTTGPCATESSFPRLTDPILNNPIDNICEKLKTSVNYADCETVYNQESNGSMAVADWYQYIPDYVLENQGTIAKVYYVQLPTGDLNNKTILALILSTKNGNIIQEQNFKDITEGLTKNTLKDQYKSYKEELILFDEIVKSVDVTE